METQNISQFLKKNFLSLFLYMVLVIWRPEIKEDMTQGPCVTAALRFVVRSTTEQQRTLEGRIEWQLNCFGEGGMGALRGLR